MSATRELYAIDQHVVPSKIVSQDFSIKVLRPGIGGDTRRLPALYITDSDHYFGGLANLAEMLQVFGEARPFLLIGIGYGSARAATLLRWRDLVTHSIRIQYKEMLSKLSTSPLIDSLACQHMGGWTTDARDFLAFIREELMPFVKKNYAVLENDNTYFGYSAGGCFGLYTLFTQPSTFKRYILGSPSTAYNGLHFGIELASTFATSGASLNAAVYMSVGELEEFERGFEKLDFVTGYYRLIKYLRACPIPGLMLTSRVLPGETHATAWTVSFSRGLRALLPPIEVSPDWRDALK